MPILYICSSFGFGVLCQVQPPSALTFLGTVGAALIGAFIGNYLKEWFTDKFTKRKRLRELRTEMIKSIGQYHGVFQRWTRNSNENRFGKFLIDAIRNSNLTQAEQDKEIDHAIARGDEYRDESKAFNLQTNELEALVVALSYECKHYLSGKKYAKLRKVVDKFFFDIQFDTMVREYDKMNYVQLGEYYRTEYNVTTSLMYQKYRFTFKTFIEVVNELI